MVNVDASVLALLFIILALFVLFTTFLLLKGIFDLKRLLEEQVTMRTRRYDKDGQPISEEQYSRLKYEDQDYHQVCSDMLANGKWISTVWVGYDQRDWWPDGPYIFSSDVFETAEVGNVLETRYYRTLPQSLQGHRDLVERWSR